MKPLIPNQVLFRLLLVAGMFIAGSGVQAQTLVPIPTNSAAVNAVLDGRTNLALASRGSISFASSCLSTTYTNTLVNDGAVGEAWIAANAANGQYVGVAFTNAGGITLGAVVFYGKYSSRSIGTRSLQYTTNASPGVGTPDSAWKQIGTYTWPAVTNIMPRSLFEFAARSNVTGIRLVMTNATIQQDLQELEAYEPPTVPTMSPVVTGASVTNYVSGRTNWALASSGGIAFASSTNTTFVPGNANNGIINGTGSTFIPGSAGTNEYLAIAFSNSITLASVVWQGQYGNRDVGFYHLDYTTNTFGGPTTNWTAIGRYYFPEGAGGVAGTILPRTYFDLATPITNVTGMRLRFLYTADGLALAIQEFEAYSPGPPVITAQPVGRIVGTGDNYTFTLTSGNATGYQWQKDGTNIPGATASSLALVNAQLTDAGSYTVVLTNAYGSVTSAPAAVLTVLQTTPPSATGAAVASVVSGRTDLALASQGSTSFASSCLSATWTNTLVNDGVTGEAWIATNAVNGQFIGVAFTNAGGVTLGALVFNGKYSDRSKGLWSLQYTTTASPGVGTPDASWTQISLYSWTASAVMPRSYFEFPAISNVTGVRLVCTNATIQPNVEELEAYAPALPAVTTPPTSATAYVGDSFTFTVVGTGAISYQWQKDGVNLAGATATNLTFGYVQLTNAGSYTVVLSNINGAVTSAPPAVLTVTNFASYQTAILAENPIHYYPLNDASGLTAADLGSSNYGGGTYTGGCTLNQPGPTTNAASVYFDGTPGTYVNLGLFHPGNEMTVECWANLDADARTSFNSVVARWDASYDFSINNNIPSFTAANAATNVTTVNAASMTRGNWHHLVAIYQTNGTQTVYKDGVATTSARVAGVLKNLAQTISPDRVLIGATRNGTNTSLNFKGYIADVAFYDHAVSSNRIVAHYNYVAPAGDTNPPVLASVASADGWTIQAVFDEAVRNASATNAIANYIINAGAATATNAVLQSDFKTVVLSLASPLAGNSFTVAASNVLDVAGNASLAANVVTGSIAQTVVANPDSLSWGKGTSNKNISITNLLANDTVAGGYVLTVIAVDATSANGVTLTTNADSIQYTGALTNDDSFNYTVTDGYGRTASALVSIMATNSVGQTTGTITVDTNGTTVVFFGISGDSYVVQRSTNLTDWVSISTNTAPASGAITNTDTFSDLVPPPPPYPSAAYYRLQTH